MACSSVFSGKWRPSFPPASPTEVQCGWSGAGIAAASGSSATPSGRRGRKGKRRELCGSVLPWLTEQWGSMWPRLGGSSTESKDLCWLCMCWNLRATYSLWRFDWESSIVHIVLRILGIILFIIALSRFRVSLILSYSTILELQDYFCSWLHCQDLVRLIYSYSILNSAISIFADYSVHDCIVKI